MPYTAVRAVPSLPVAGTKNGTFRAYMANETKRRTTTYIIFMPVSVIFHCVPMENAIFAPTTGRLDMHFQ